MARFLYKGDLSDDLLHMNWLKEHQVEFLYKNKYFFIPEISFSSVKNLDKKDILLQNIEMGDSEIEYYSIINRVPIGTKRVQGLFADYQEQAFTPSNFIFPESGYLAGGNLIALYFRSPLCANPLDVLWVLGQSLQFKQPYYSILFDYLPAQDEIIYQLIFRFNHQKFQANLQEIIQMKGLITQVDWSQVQLTTGANGYPEIHREFQKQVLGDYPTWNQLDFKVEFMRPVVYLPEGEEVIAAVESLIVGG